MDDRIASIDDVRLLAKRKLPKVIFDYVDGGADAELTLRANRDAFDSITFSPRYGLSLQKSSLQTSVLNEVLGLPVLLAPIGHSSLLYPKGELAAARAAGLANTVYVLSTLSGERLEDVRASTKGPAWYQLYLWGGRDAAEVAIDRAKKSGYSALVVTIDSAIGGKRIRDIHNDASYLFNGGSTLSIPVLKRLISHPLWLTRFLFNGGLPGLPNIATNGARRDSITKLSYQAVTWTELRWIRDIWKGPIVVKGVITAHDAKRSIDEGADALVVSNHGGRQLDSLPSSLHALSEVIASVGTKTPVLLDGGVRRGSDIVKALCLGARAVLCGRAFAYGLAAAGETGVTCVLSILKDELERTLRLLGCESTSSLNSTYLTKSSINRLPTIL